MFKAVLEVCGSEKTNIVRQFCDKNYAAAAKASSQGIFLPNYALMKTPKKKSSTIKKHHTYSGRLWLHKGGRTGNKRGKDGKLHFVC
jgi:hypothetical protein